MEGNSTGQKPDPDRTDRLPTLTQDKIVALGNSRQPGCANEQSQQPSGAQKQDPTAIPNALLKTIREGAVRTRRLATRLAVQEQTIAELKQAVETVSAQADQTVSEQTVTANFAALKQTVEAVSERQTRLETAATDALHQAESAQELIGTVQGALDTLSQRIATLETYIAGRPDGWREMEQALHAKSTRVAEAEAQLAEKIALLAGDLSWPEPASSESTEPEPAEPESAEPESPETASAEPVTAEPVTAQPVAAEPAPPTRVRIPALVGLSPNAPVACAIENDSIIIGRDPDCDISIPTHSVSRKHAVVLIEGNDAVIEDRSSTNGVFVNELRVNRAVLSDGDEIAIGDSRFRFVGGEQRD